MFWIPVTRNRAVFYIFKSYLKCGWFCPENKWQPFLPGIVFLPGWPLPHSLPSALHLDHITVYFGDIDPGVQAGDGMGVRTNANLIHQFLNISSAHVSPGRTHLLDPGTSLIACNSHQLCKNTVTATTTTITTEDYHKAQEALKVFCIILLVSEGEWCCANL